jgi:multiple sugar transport system permease protein
MGSQEYTSQTFIDGSAPWNGLENYRAIFSNPVFLTSLSNTFAFTVFSIIGQFVIGMSLAVFFQRMFPLSRLLRSLVLLPWLIPLIASAAVWKWILDQDSGILNVTLVGLHIVDSPIPWISSPSVALLSIVAVNIWLGIPFNTILLFGGLQEVPREYYEAAELDGAVGWKAFWHITWPSVQPTVSVVLVLGVVYTLKVLDIIIGLTNGGPANSTETLTTFSYHLSFVSFNFGQGAAVGNVLIVVSLVFALTYLWITRRNARAQA